MQKLTILFLITLILPFHLFAEDEPIELDRDILYWKPAGPDILIPDSYFSPELFQYSADAFKSSLFFPLIKDEKDVSRDNERTLSEEIVSSIWNPPALSFENEQDIKAIRKPDLTFFSSFPYGSGLLVAGKGDRVSYGTGVNYAFGDDYPHWLAGDFAVNETKYDLDTRFAWRLKNEASFLSLINMTYTASTSGRETSSDQTDIRGTVAFQSLYPLDDAPSIAGSHTDNVIEKRVHQWTASALLGGNIDIFGLNTGASLTNEYRQSRFASYWRISPELLLTKKYSAGPGDWSFQGGILSDFFINGPRFQYFPLLGIEFINYSKWSFYLLSKSEKLNENLVHDFLTEEVYSSPESTFYRFHTLETGFHITLEKVQVSMGSGFVKGIFPEINKNILESAKKSLFFIDSSISWNYKAGKVTELKVYADYQDRGSLRFMTEGRWYRRKSNSSQALSFLLRAGDSELLRGYKYVFNDNPDLLTGTGVEIELSKPLQAAVYMDYLPLNKRIEGRIELIWTF